MNPNQRFAELAGICLHDEGVEFDGARYRCPPCDATINCDNPTPDFDSEPWRVLEVMMAREDWIEFADAHFLISTIDINGVTEYAVQIDYILDHTGKLRDAAITWMEGKKK